jgi:hypothetical protein
MQPAACVSLLHHSHLLKGGLQFSESCLCLCLLLLRLLHLSFLGLQTPAQHSTAACTVQWDGKPNILDLKEHCKTLL